MSAENLFSRSWQLLSRNWAIVIPGLLVGIVAGIVQALLSPTVVVGDSSVVVTTPGFFAGSINLIVQVLAAIVTITYTTGMAAAAWRTGTAAFSDGATAFSNEGSKVFTAMLALIVVWIIAAILALPTLGISMIAAFFLFVYAMAAAVIGHVGGFGALSASYKLAATRWQTTAIIVILLAVISICAGLVVAIFKAIPFIGPIAAQVVDQVVLAYFTLVIAGEYMSQAGAPAAAQPAAAASQAWAPPPQAAAPPPPPAEPQPPAPPPDPPTAQ
jgi:flagellar biosynthesis protein FliQ